MKYRNMNTNELFDTIKQLQDATLSADSENFSLNPQVPESRIQEVHEMEILQDDEPWNPIDEDPAFIWLFCSRKYGLNKTTFSTSEEFNTHIKVFHKAIQWSKSHGLYHRVYAYDHSGLYFQLDSTEGLPDRQWDCYQIGIVFADPEQLRERFGWKRISKKRLGGLKAILDLELKEENSYISGDCYVLHDVDADDFIESGTYRTCLQVAEDLVKTGKYYLAEGGEV